MKKGSPQSAKHLTERFQDPLGAYMQTVTTAHEQHMGRFAPVDEVYQGFYATFTPQSKDGMSYLGGVEGIIGNELELKLFDEGLGFVARDGRRVALLSEHTATRLMALMEQNWVIHIVLAYTSYSAEERSFTGGFACMCYSSELEEEAKSALEVFIRNIVERIASATRPGLTLTQEQFVRVIESKGAWFLTRDEPWPQLPEGSVYYRRRKTLSDRLVGVALKGNKGCLVLSWIVLAVLAGALVLAIWFFFFR
ncbi:MAG: hypothetical protein LBL27_01550 [Coriobacteriales bacterium]|jgi:hypothetical protein|nr:hypothetical protein [Coriobacteriales bacterium]